MYVTILDHAKESIYERGAKESEVIKTVEVGEMVAAKVGRMRYVKNFNFDSTW